MSTLWLLISPLTWCLLYEDEERDGVNFYVRNRTAQPVDVTFVLEDPARGGRQVATGHVQLAAADGFGLDAWDGPTVPVVVRATVRGPEGVLAELQGEWPGDAGFGDGGARVGVQVIVDAQGARFDPSI